MDIEVRESVRVKSFSGFSSLVNLPLLNFMKYHEVSEILFN